MVHSGAGEEDGYLLSVRQQTMGTYLALYLVLAFHRATNAFQNDRFVKESSLSQIFTCMNKVADYYELNNERMNLDGIFGARLAAGQLKGFLVSVGKTDAEDSRLMEELNKTRILQNRFQKIADDGGNYVETTEPEYYENMGFIIYDGHWEQFYPWREIDPSLSIPLSQREEGEQISEDISDLCISELIRQNCAITKYCWEKMTSPGYSYYSLTHELLYLMIANDYGCKKQAETLAKDTYNKTIDELQGAFCSNVVEESEKIADENFPRKRRDIFLEQIAICGSLGYYDFLRKQWLENILLWQHEEGCFGFRSKTERTKRENWELGDGCSSHGTAVAIAALAQHVKYFVDSAIHKLENT